jgi:tetrahedral aminopeptidase
MKDLIKKLVETTGPSGYETKVRELVRAEIEPHADEIRIDPLGNLIACKGHSNGKGANGAGKKIMISAHMDEIGIVVTHVDKNGFARFTNIGGVYPRNCVGGRVRFLNGALGVMGLETTANTSPSLSDMFIDLGATSPKDCPVKIGDIAAFERPFMDLGNRLVSKAMDDRIGVAVGIETLRQLKSTPHEVSFVFSVQEEVGLRGATTSAFGVDPDIGIAIDVTASGDTPKGLKMDVGLGKGAAIKVRDGGMLSDPRVVDWMVKTAKKKNIPHQLEILEGGTTDARAIQTSRAGVPAGCVSIPCRYVHSPSEMVDYNDVQNGVKLLVAMLSQSVQL